MFCMPGGRPFAEKLKHVAKDAMAVIAWGSCASWGCVQAAKPNPTSQPSSTALTQASKPSPASKGAPKPANTTTSSNMTACTTTLALSTRCRIDKS